MKIPPNLQALNVTLSKIFGNDRFFSVYNKAIWPLLLSFHSACGQLVTIEGIDINYYMFLEKKKRENKN